MKYLKFWYAIPLCVSIIFLFLSFISKRLIEMNVNTDVIPLYDFTIYIHTILLFAIPIFIYVFLAFGINFATIVTSTEHIIHLKDITKWLALAFIFPLITESFYAINYYINIDNIIVDNMSFDKINKIGAFTILQYNLINYARWLCVLLFMFVIQYIKFNVSSTNSKQSELCVNSSCNIDTRLLRKATICSNCTQQVYDKIIKAPVS